MKKNNRETIAVVIPTYNGEKTIFYTMKSLLKQIFKQFSIVVQDDASTDDTLQIIRSFKDKRIKIFTNKINLGCQKNMEKARKKAKSDIVFFVAQDDILSKKALELTYNAFQISKDIGFVTRPYYWFDDSVEKPVRITPEINPYKNEIISMQSNYNDLITVIDTIGQISGLAYRSKYASTGFHTDIFSGHAYLFASILKKHKGVFLKDITVAVRIQTSQSRLLSNLYAKSPIQTWVDFAHTVFWEKKYLKFREYFIRNYVAVNYVGLLQIRNYSKFSYVVREIYLLLYYRWKNIMSIQFWLITILCLFPPFVLRRIVDWYKKYINSLFIKKNKITLFVKTVS